MMADATLLLDRLEQLASGQYAFAGRSMTAAVAAGVACGVAGIVPLLRRNALVGDAGAHTSLAGVAAGAMATGHTSGFVPSAGAAAAVLLAMMAIPSLAARPRMRPDAAVGVVLAGGFALGLVLLSRLQADGTVSTGALTAMLLGNVASTTDDQVRVLLGVALLTTAAHALAIRQLVPGLFDPTWARAMGADPRTLRFGQPILLALVIAATIPVTGAVLVAGMLVLPGATALLVARSVPAALALAAVLGGVSGGLGGAVSFLFEGFSTGPSMVVAAGVLFGCVAGARALFAARGAAHG